MVEIIDRFLGRGPEKKDKVSPHEIAKLVRDRQLDIFDFGVVGSDTEVPHESNKKATKIPTLLKYSSETIRHLQTLRGILSSPKEFEIESNTETSIFDENITADILYQQADGNHIYYFTRQFTETFLNGWNIGPNLKEDLGQMLIVAIINVNKKRKGMWKVSYNFFASDFVSPNCIPSSAWYPENHMLMQFWYSPKKLDGNYFSKNLPLSQYMRNYTTYIGEGQSSEFRFFNFKYDSLKQAADIERDPIWQPDINQKGIKLLRTRGNIDFSIVEIGTVTLDGVKHWVYTGSEQSGIQVRQDAKVKNAVLKPSSATE